MNKKPLVVITGASSGIGEAVAKAMSKLGHPLLLLARRMDGSLVDSTTYGFGAAVGFSLVLVLFSAMRERIAAADVPTPFRGTAIGMISAGLMSLAFMGFTGLIKL